jgi:anaerobic ribonucleoside-triphosphate reductase activating protein
MNYAGLNTCDSTNGDGLRVSLFVSGCSLHCKGCFNKEAWDKNFGKEFTEETLGTLIEALRSPYIDGLSILGGDPLEPYNIPTVSHLVALVKQMFPEKTIWLWTGRKYENIKDLALLKYIDVLITEPFIERKKCHGKYFGSSNQRVLRKSSSNPKEFIKDHSCETEP